MVMSEALLRSFQSRESSTKVLWYTYTSIGLNARIPYTSIGLNDDVGRVAGIMPRESLKKSTRS